MPLLEALLALQPLHDLPRTGWILRGIETPESVGDHVLATAFLVLALGPRVEPAIDVERALAMAVLHDVPEALIGDLPKSAAELLPPGAKQAAEQQAARQLITPLSGLALERWQEYCAKATREARFARICDRLQLGLRLVAYVRAGRRGLDEFQGTVRELDCSEFPAAAELKAEILAAL
ncbi:MAG: HD domain-containing protein [Planctomycetes bacterium]|nr:HD domain-containing protein [Planctomycetota bacterium]